MNDGDNKDIIANAVTVLLGAVSVHNWHIVLALLHF